MDEKNGLKETAPVSQPVAQNTIGLIVAGDVVYNQCRTHISC